MREISAARFYELMVITTPEGTPEELVGVVDQITGYVEAAGGTILRANYDSPWGRRRLSYPIRHESQDVRDGFYTLVHLQIEPDKVSTIERDLKLNERLMRYLVLQLASEPVFPEPVAEETEGEEATDHAEGGEPADASTSGGTQSAEPAETAGDESSAVERRSVVASADAESEPEPESVGPDVEAETAESAALITQSSPDDEAEESEEKE
jgi:small subunit ribosomal protein S6